MNDRFVWKQGEIEIKLPPELPIEEPEIEPEEQNNSFRGKE